MTQIPLRTLAREKRQLQIIPLGDEMPYDFKRPHRHEYFEFFIFFNGGGSHFIDFAEYTIVGSSVHIVFPGQIHLLKRSGARGLIIICTREFVDSLSKIFYAQLFQNNFTAPSIVFTDERFSALEAITRSLQDELQEKKILSGELAKSYMSLFLSFCIRDFVAAPLSGLIPLSYTQHELDVYRKFSALLEKHFMNKQNVSFYAEALSMTPKVLNNCLRKITGKTCIDLVQERTLTEAKRLLLYTDESSKEIAYALNFRDSSYFTRFFTKLEGQTPLAFKSYWEEKYHS